MILENQKKSKDIEKKKEKEFYTNQFSFDVQVLTKFEQLHHQMLMQKVMVMLDAMKHS